MSHTNGQTNGKTRTNGKARHNHAHDRGATGAAGEWRPRPWNPERVPRHDPTGDAGLIDMLTRIRQPREVAKLLRGDFSPDHVLGNISEDELWYRRFAIRTNLEIVSASAPPEQSVWRGARRDAIGLGGLAEPITPELTTALLSGADAAYSRNTRALEGWQQKLVAENQSERRIVEERAEEPRGLLSKLVGGGR